MYIGVLAHTGNVRNDILNLKYHQKREVAQTLAQVVVVALDELGLTDAPTVITWAPTSNAQRRQRGYDQSELICRHVGAYLHKPVRKLLVKEGISQQTGKSRAHRLRGVRFRAKFIPHGSTVLVVDDVVTTGATFESAVRSFIKYGVSNIICIAPSRTIYE